MKRILQTYSVLIVTVSLFSCHIEKRLYRSGYYISSPEIVKNEPCDKTHADRYADLCVVNESKMMAPEVQKKITKTIFSSPAASSSQEISGKSENTKIIQGPKKVLDHKQPAKEISKHVTEDNDKIKKDVRNLLMGSIGTLLGALLYGLFLSLNILPLANAFFILTPFAIIGIWIFALLLHTKYSREDSLEVKTKKERIITKRKAFLLAGFLGIFGAHRFYLGYTEMGILQMLTLGGFFVLFFIDLIRIKNGKLKPKKGDYDREENTYTQGKSKKKSNRSQKLIKLAVLITLAALMLILGFALFL